MKTRPGANAGLGNKIFAALTAGAVVASEVAHGVHHPHPEPEVYGERFENHPAARPYFKAGVDSPQDVAARNFEANMNFRANEGHGLAR